jgi:hypothetical protein
MTNAIASPVAVRIAGAVAITAKYGPGARFLPGRGPRSLDAMEPIRFRSEIRYWNPEKQSGLAVADVPSEHVAAIGGLKQQHVRGRIGGAAFASNVMPAGGGRLALSVSKAMQRAAGVGMGDAIEVEITAIGRD